MEGHGGHGWWSGNGKGFGVVCRQGYCIVQLGREGIVVRGLGDEHGGEVWRWGIIFVEELWTWMREKWSGVLTF